MLDKKLSLTRNDLFGCRILLWFPEFYKIFLLHSVLVGITVPTVILSCKMSSYLNIKQLQHQWPSWNYSKIEILMQNINQWQWQHYLLQASMLLASSQILNCLLCTICTCQDRNSCRKSFIHPSPASASILCQGNTFSALRREKKHIQETTDQSA